MGAPVDHVHASSWYESAQSALVRDDRHGTELRLCDRCNPRAAWRDAALAWCASDSAESRPRRWLCADRERRRASSAAAAADATAGVHAAARCTGGGCGPGECTTGLRSQVYGPRLRPRRVRWNLRPVCGRDDLRRPRGPLHHTQA